MAEEYIIYKVTYKTNGSKEAERYVGFAAGDDLTESQSFLEKKVEAEGKRFYFVSIEKTEEKSPRKGIIFPADND